MSGENRVERGTDAKALLDQLKQAGMTPAEIAEALEGRVSRRTIYRWTKGDTIPQRGADVDALRELASKRLTVA